MDAKTLCTFLRMFAIAVPVSRGVNSRGVKEISQQCSQYAENVPRRTPMFKSRTEKLENTVKFRRKLYIAMDGAGSP